MPKLLYLHGLHGSPSGTKVQYLRENGFEVVAPSLSKDDFDGDVRKAQAAFDEHRPDAVVGSSRGGAVALSIHVGTTPLVLIAPAWKHWGGATSVKSEAYVLHSDCDELIPLTDSRTLLENSGLDPSRLIVVGEAHPLNDDAALAALRDTLNRLTAIQSANHPNSATLGNVQRRAPLGLPRGSVRALLTLLIVAVVVTEVVRGNAVPLLWTETLMIAMAHYFTSRRFIQLPPAVIRSLEAQGHLEAESNPLFLPRHSIRAVVVLSFVGLAVYLYMHNRLFRQEALAILGTVFAYLIGVLLRPVFEWWSKGATETAQWWEDIKAAAVLLALAATALAFLIGKPELLPQIVRNATLGLVLFYFGSR